MLKLILSAIVSLGLSATAFAEGTETTPAPTTGTETPAMPKAEKPMKGKAGEGKHGKKEHKTE